MEEINLFSREDAAVAEIVQLKDEAKRVAREASTHSFSDTMRISSFLRVLSIIDYYQRGLLSWNEVGINCARRRDGLDQFIHNHPDSYDISAAEAASKAYWEAYFIINEARENV